MNPLISIIIPIYNVDKYLEKCINSILGQPFQNLEILLIDDGSTDQSKAICDTYAAKDIRIKVFHQKNSGVSVARNKGIELAKGTWIAFIDADDYISVRYFEKILSAIELNPDLICWGWNHLTGGETIRTNKIFHEDKNFKKSEFLKKNIFSGYVWTYLFKKDYISENQLEFSSDMKYAEDWEFIIKYLVCTKKTIYVISDCLYNQKQRKGSATQIPLGEKYIVDNFEMFKRVLCYTKADHTLYRYVAHQLSKLTKWFVVNVVYTDVQMLQKVYRHEWLTLCRIDWIFAMHPLVSAPNICKKSTYNSICHIMNAVISKRIRLRC